MKATESEFQTVFHDFERIIFTKNQLTCPKITTDSERLGLCEEDPIAKRFNHTGVWFGAGSPPKVIKIRNMDTWHIMNVLTYCKKNQERFYLKALRSPKPKLSAQDVETNSRFYFLNFLLPSPLCTSMLKTLKHRMDDRTYNDFYNELIR